jgi:GNAT superfamily N-acetyltransferase
MSSPHIRDIEIRVAEPLDVDALAETHRDSIESIGPAFYLPNDVEAWKDGLAGDVYLRAMEAGEVFFVATGTQDRRRVILGFASDYHIEAATHGTSVYVRGVAARRGIGTALLRQAEAHALANGARSIQIEASLAGVAFYTANGYVEVLRGQTRLMSGHVIASVRMRKELDATRSVGVRQSSPPK